MLHAAKGMPVMPTAMRYRSIAGSHSNVTLRAFLHAAEALDPSSLQHLISGDKFSLEKLGHADQQFAEAARSGLNWLVISKEVENMFPELASVAQSAANVSVAKVESELQVLRKIHANVVDRLKGGSKTVCWDDVKGEVLRSKPTCGPYAPSMFSFILKCSGGLTGQLMRDTEKYVNAVGHVHRSLGGDVFGALIQDVKGPDQHVPTRHMLVRAGYCNDASIKVSDIKKVFSAGMALKRSEAERVYIQAKEVASTHSSISSSDAVSTLLGDLTVNLAQSLMAKKSTKPGECGHQFIQLLSDCIEKKIESPWERSDEHEVRSTSKKRKDEMAKLALHVRRTFFKFF